MMAGCVMIALILLLRTFALKRLPKWLFRALWLITAARMLLPCAIPLTVKVPAVQTVRLPRAVLHSAAETVPVTVEKVGMQIFPWETVLTAVYLAGVIVITGFFLFSCVRLNRIARRAEAQTLCGISVRVGKGFDSPFSCGFLNPVIFVPSHMLSLETKQLECILAHEMCHIRRHDLPAKWLILAAVCVHWWNPMAWLMLRYANRDLELACDEAASSGSDRAAYALCLIAAEEVRSAAPTAFFGAPAIRERIECIMNRKHLTVCSFICAAAILAAATPFFVRIEAVPEESAAASADVTEAEIIADDTTEASYAAEGETDEVTNHEVSEGEIIYDAEYEVDEVTNHEVSVNEIIYDAEYEVDEGLICEEFSVSEESDAECESSLEMAFPLTAEYRISQGFSDSHPAVDLAAAKDSDILAVMDGTVITARPDYTLGNYLEIDHGNGLVTTYAHCTRFYVKAGDTVKAGDVIAAVGRTGMATGPHLHFAISEGGVPVMPEGLFDPADFPKKPF